MPPVRPRPGTRRAAAALVAAALAVAIGVAPAASPGRAATPPPTPVPPSGSPSPFPTALQTPRTDTKPPALSSASAVLEDLDTGQVLLAKHADVRRPVASLTKLMTALVVLEEADLSDTVVVSARAAGQSGSELGLQVGERVKVRHLLYALLLQSSNDAAVALSEHVAGTVEAFVGRMNRRAARMGLRDTEFRSATGLDDRGYSTARDLAAITRAAYADPTFARIVRTKFHTVPAASGADRRIQNRNILLWLYPWAIGGKTGFTTPAGHCLMATADQGTGVRLVAVALGAGGRDAGDVFDDGAALLNFGWGGFDIVTFARQGQPVGTIPVGGLDVVAVAGSDLVQLVRTTRSDGAASRLVAAYGLRLPVVAGQVVGRQVAFVGHEQVGAVDAVAASTVFAPPPPPPPPGEGGPSDSPLLLVMGLLRALGEALLRAFL